MELKDPKELLDVALLTMQRDLHRLSNNSLAGELEHMDAKTLTDYIKTLIAYNKDMRQGAKELDVSEMSDEELKAELQKLQEDGNGLD